MKTRITLAIALLMALFITSCTGKKSTTTESQENNDMKTLVLYYSQTGTTKALAEALQSQLGGDIEAIEIENPYAGSYAETIARVQSEREQGITPVVLPLKHNPAEYEIVFLGYPIWFGTYAPPISGLLKSVDLNGKIIVPFCTFGSGGLESSTRDLKAQLPDAKILEGYGVRTARISKMPNELNRFLIENGYVEGEVEALPAFSEMQPVSEAQTAIFDVACGDYQFPLGTPVEYCMRAIPEGIEYQFNVRSQAPDGSEASASILVIDNGEKPEFTKVIR